jgi:hypothetical protein
MRNSVYYICTLLLLATPAFAFSSKKIDDARAGSSQKVSVDDPAQDFGSWCQNRFGHLTPDQSLCVTQLNYRFGKAVHKAVWSSPVRLASMDTVTVSYTGTPHMLIGINESEPSNGTFVSAEDGILAFSGQEKFSITSVQVKRCFDGRAHTVLCRADQSTAEEEPKAQDEKKKEPASIGA